MRSLDQTVCRCFRTTASASALFQDASARSSTCTVALISPENTRADFVLRTQRISAFIGLVGTGFEVDTGTAVSRGGFIGTTAGGDAVSTGIPVTPLAPEYSDSFDLSFRYTSRRFGAELTGFTTKLKDVYFDQALVLPPGATGTFLGSEQIILQNAAGLVFVAAAPTTPVLVRVNFDDARFNGVEFNSRARFTDQFSGTANFTYIRAHSLFNGLPPNVEGGVPPATGFVSLRYQPRSRFYVEGYSTMAARQNRLSSLDLADRRTGAARSRANIQNFFRRGACVRGLTTSRCGRLRQSREEF